MKTAQMGRTPRSVERKCGASSRRSWLWRPPAVGTGRVVVVVEGDASMGWIVVRAGAADDPVKPAELRPQLLRMVDEDELPE